MSSFHIVTGEKTQFNWKSTSILIFLNILEREFFAEGNLN